MIKNDDYDVLNKIDDMNDVLYDKNVNFDIDQIFYLLINIQGRL